MAQREIIWTSKAQDEFANILSYFLERNQSNIYSLKLIGLVENITKTIAKNPLVGLQNKDDLSRTFIFERYSIIYDFDDRQISILSIWDDRQHSEKKLAQKKSE